MALFGNTDSTPSKPIDYGAAASDLFSGVGAILGGFAGAAGANASADQYKNAATVSKEQTAIAESMQARKITLAQGATKADVSGAGFSFSGSAQDIFRSNAQQGALAKAAIQHQGTMEFDAYTGQAKAAKAAAQNALWGGIVQGVGEIAGAAIAAG